MQVPEGWKTVKLNTIASVKRGAGSQYIEYVERVSSNTIRLIRISDFLGDSPKFVKRTKDIERFLLQKDDILIAGTGATAGIIFEVPESMEGMAYSYNAPRIKVGNRANKIFIVYYLKSEGILKQQARLFTGNAQPFLDTKAIGGFNIYLPPLEEQHKVAQVLSTWDKAISTTEQLLTNSQQQKKALMQQLLTGKKRLLDDNGQRFSGEWKKMLFGDVFEKISNGITYDTKATEGLPVSRIETISTGKIDYKKVGWAPDDETTKRHMLISGDILYSHINSLEHIGRVAYYDAEQPLYHGMNLLLLRLKKGFVSKFFYQLLSSEFGKRYASEYAKSAVNQASISTTDIKSFKALVPSLDEQQKIATVLTAADQETTQLQQKLDQIKQEKKALMQQLLTGKRRVLVS